MIENFVNKCHDTFKFTLSDFAEQRPPSRGVIWHGGCVHEFLNTHVIVAADKDGDQVVMSLKTYLMEQNNNMGVVHKNGDPVYRKLGDFTTDQELMWTDQAKVWRRDIAITAITLLESHNVDEPLTELLQNFFERSPPLKMPIFYMQVKTHKRKSIRENSWPSRPITALTSWFTTPPSIILSTLGKIFLRFDAWQDAKNTPLTDTLDFVQRIHNFKHWVDGDHDQYVLTSFDFTALYTNFTFSDLSKAFRYWRDEWKNTCLNNFEITLHERAYVRWLTEPIGERWFRFIDTSFPFFNMQYDPEVSLGEVFLHLIFTHNIFKAPGSGIYRQAQGFSMGTNCAPAWANLALRCFERLGQKALPCILLRFIDDGACIHHRAHTPQITAMLSSWYPPHLPFEVLALGVSADIIFLDLHVLDLHEPRYCTHFKPTNSATYIPWSSNTPRGTKLGWRRGEGVRFLRTNSHERYFLAAVKRMNGACRRLGYPKTLCSSLPVSWSEKDRYMTRNSKTKGRRVGNFLEFFRIHVWRVPYEACIPLKYGDPIHRLNQQIKQSIPGTKLFAVNRPQPNLRKRWHRALVKTLNDLGNVQPAADSLSMDASLLLNCRAAAENGNCSQSKRRRVA